MKHVITVLGALTVTKALQPGVYTCQHSTGFLGPQVTSLQPTCVSTAGFPLILTQSPQIDEILAIGAAIAQLGFSSKKSVSFLSCSLPTSAPAPAVFPRMTWGSRKESRHNSCLYGSGGPAWSLCQARSPQVVSRVR